MQFVDFILENRKHFRFLASERVEASLPVYLYFVRMGIEFEFSKLIAMSSNESGRRRTIACISEGLALLEHNDIDEFGLTTDPRKLLTKAEQH